jgi:carboxylate-amine ligase
VRPHHIFGTVEVRICDAQTRGEESFALGALIAACIAQAALDYDSGTLPSPPRQREIEENLWRAIRWGLDGKLIDFERRVEVATREAAKRLVEWTAPAREVLGLEVEVPEWNGAQRARQALAEGRSIEDVYREAVAETRRTYVPEGVTSG